MRFQNLDKPQSCGASACHPFYFPRSASKALGPIFLLPSEQPLAHISRVKPQGLTDMVKGENPIAAVCADPLFCVVEKHLSSAAFCGQILLKTINRVFQDRQHEPFLRLQESPSTHIVEILRRQQRIGLE
jgi:hypothetical protein